MWQLNLSSSEDVRLLRNIILRHFLCQHKNLISHTVLCPSNLHGHSMWPIQNPISARKAIASGYFTPHSWKLWVLLLNYAIFCVECWRLWANCWTKWTTIGCFHILYATVKLGNTQNITMNSTRNSELIGQNGSWPANH